MVNNLFYGQHQGRANFQHLRGTNKALSKFKNSSFASLAYRMSTNCLLLSILIKLKSVVKIR